MADWSTLVNLDEVQGITRYRNIVLCNLFKLAEPKPHGRPLACRASSRTSRSTTLTRILLEPSSVAPGLWQPRDRRIRTSNQGRNSSLCWEWFWSSLLQRKCLLFTLSPAMSTAATVRTHDSSAPPEMVLESGSNSAAGISRSKSRITWPSFTCQGTLLLPADYVALTLRPAKIF